MQPTSNLATARHLPDVVVAAGLSNPELRLRQAFGSGTQRAELAIRLTAWAAHWRVSASREKVSSKEKGAVAPFLGAPCDTPMRASVALANRKTQWAARPYCTRSRNVLVRF